MSVNTEVICIKTGMMDNNTWLVKNKETDEGFLVDASFSPGLIADRIRKEGVKLKGILLTHCHYDHIYSVEDIRREFSGDGVLVYAGADERELLCNPSFNLLQKHRLPGNGTEADVYLKDGEERSIAGIPVKTIFTPGHTKGGACFLLESEKLLLSGDTLFAGSYGRTDLPTGDASEIYRSVTQKLFTLPEDIKVLPGHGEITDIAYEKKYNPVLRLND